MTGRFLLKQSDIINRSKVSFSACTRNSSNPVLALAGGAGGYAC